MMEGFLLTGTTGVSLGLVAIIVGALWGVQRWVSGAIRRVDETARIAREAQEKAHAAEIKALQAMTESKIDELHGRANRLREDFAAFQIDAAKRFVSDERLTRTEDKLSAGLDALRKSFDAFARDFHQMIGKHQSGSDREA